MLADSLPPLMARAQRHGRRTAIVDHSGSYTYDDLLQASAQIATMLLGGRDDLREQRIAFLVSPSFNWVATQWGIWRAGGVSVPLPLGTPTAELDYYVGDTQTAAMVADAANRDHLASIAVDREIRLHSCDQAQSRQSAALPDLSRKRRAMILFTSGTTSRPKGVVTTHAAIAAQIETLIEAWEWSPDDRILLCLPLHHVHGIINVVSCALWSGAVCETLPRFDPEAVWERIAGGDFTLFMGVPTIYVKLIAAWEASSPERRKS